MRDVNYGWLLRYMHSNGASFFFLAVYIHMFRGLYYGSYKAPREVLWILGVLIYVLMIATAFLGYTLPWGQMSFWGATVITNFFSAIPLVGHAIITWLWGGFGVDNATLQRFFSLHYLLPFVIAGVVVLHIWALHVPGNNNPLGIDVKGPQDTVPFHPYYTVKDLFYLSCFLILFSRFRLLRCPTSLGNPDNYTPANPIGDAPRTSFPNGICCRSTRCCARCPHKLIGVIVLFGARSPHCSSCPGSISSKVRSCRFRPVMKQFFWFFVADCFLLGYIGSQSAEAVWHLSGFDLPLVWLARLGTLYYFAQFWVIMPVVGLIERPKPLPGSIAQAVLAPAG